MTDLELVDFDRNHLDGALALFAAEGWEAYTEDPERTLRVLTAPGATTVVAIDGDRVAGAIQVQSDGEIQAHLSALVVGGPWRGRGVARRLLHEALARAGGMRLDLLTQNGGYYRALGAAERPGFRLWPETLDG